MKELIFITKQKRVRCSDEKFLEAIYTSSTYSEIAEKTGQKISTVMARYTRLKKSLLEENIEIPEIQRKKPTKKIDSKQKIIEIVKRLKEYHSNM